jgi:hypothetical protein
VKYFYIIFVTSVALGWLGGRAQRAKPRRVQDRWFFYPILSIYVLYVVFATMSTGFVIWGAFGPRDFRPVGISIGAAFLGFLGLTWLKTVEVSPKGLRQRAWWGGWKKVDWVDVSDYEERQDRCVVVRGHHCKIVVSPYHGGRDLFLEKLRARLEEKSPGLRKRERRRIRRMSSLPVWKSPRE